jgi:hypothetical protein
MTGRDRRYVEVAEVTDVTHRACLLGAPVLRQPREGPTGWRSVVAVPAGGKIVLAAEGMIRGNPNSVGLFVRRRT